MRPASFIGLVRFLLPLLLASSAGCSTEKDRVEKQLSSLKDEVAHLQSVNDRMGERLDAMEMRQAAVPHYPEERVKAPSAGTLSRPKLKVVRVEPGAEGSASPEAEAADAPPTEDTGPRLLIQGEGKALESRTMGSAPVAAKTTKPEASKKDTKAGREKAAKAEQAKSEAVKLQVTESAPPQAEAAPSK